MEKAWTTKFVLAPLMFASLGAVASSGNQNSQQSPSSSSPQTWNQICTQNPANPSSPSWNKVLQQSSPSPGNAHWNQLITAGTYPDHLCPYTPGCQTIQGACSSIAGTYGVPAGYTIGSIVLHDCGGTITTNQGGCSPPPPSPPPPVVHHAAATVTYQPPGTYQPPPPPQCPVGTFGSYPFCRQPVLHTFMAPGKNFTPSGLQQTNNVNQLLRTPSLAAAQAAAMAIASQRALALAAAAQVAWTNAQKAKAAVATTGCTRWSTWIGKYHRTVCLAH